MKEIPLTQGKVALVDDADFGYLNLFKWYAKESKVSWYAVRMKKTKKIRCAATKGQKTKRVAIRMHNTIMQPSENEYVHHRDSNGLNNQRYNFKVTDLAENNQLAADKKKENQTVREEVPF